MKRLIGHAIRGILLLGMLLCLGKAINAYNTLEMKANLVGYELNQSISYEEVLKLSDQAKDQDFRGDFTAVHELSGQSVFEGGTSTSAKVSLLEICGDASVIYETLPNFSEIGERECLISSAAAAAIFGGSDVVGLQVNYKAEEKTLEFTILGVIPSEEMIMMVPYAVLHSADVEQEEDSSQKDTFSMAGEEGNNTKKADAWKQEKDFETLILNVHDFSDQEKDQLCTKFQNIAGISDDTSIRMDYQFYKDAAAFLLFLLPFVITLMMVGMILRFQARVQRKPFWFAGGLLLLICIIFTWLHGSSVRVALPGSWIPMQWSDFDFWQNRVKAMIELIRSVLFTQRGLLEISYYNQLISSMLYIVCAAFFYFLSVRKLKIGTISELATIEIGVLAITILGLWVLVRQGETVNRGYYWWLLNLYHPVLRWLTELTDK